MLTVGDLLPDPLGVFEARDEAVGDPARTLQEESTTAAAVGVLASQLPRILTRQKCTFVQLLAQYTIYSALIIFNA